MVQQDKSVAIVGAGDYIGSAIAKKFAAEGYIVVAGRRNGDKLARWLKRSRRRAAGFLRTRWTHASRTM